MKHYFILAAVGAVSAVVVAGALRRVPVSLGGGHLQHHFI